VARVVAQEDGTPADSLVLVERGQRLHVGRVLGFVMRRFVELTLGFLTAEPVNLFEAPASGI
jgi:hypothetical protein